MKMIRIIGKKTLYNLDNEQSLKQWAMEPVKKLKTFDMPNVSSAISIKDSPSNCGRNFKGAMGYLLSSSNNINKNAQSVGLFSTPISMGHGFGINKDNFDRVVCLFSARKLIIANWTNWTDEYLAPDESNPKYKEFVNDSVVFSLFHPGSNLSSLRNVDYKNKENNNE